MSQFQLSAQAIHAAVDVVAKSGDRDLKDVGGFGIAVAMSVDKEDGDPLIVSEALQRNLQAGFRLVAEFCRFLNRQQRSSSSSNIAANRCLSDSVQISGRVVHRDELVAVLPCPPERVGERFTAEFDAVSGNQCPPEARAHRAHELLERVPNL